MREEKYTLNWHTYSDHLRDILKEMSLDNSFADVTLVTDDKKQMKAHRNILSAGSSVFKEILQINTSNSHPVIYLRGIQHSEMESILQFIYLGEANVLEKRMNEFLTVAKNLDIPELRKGIEDRDFDAVNNENTSIERGELPIQTKDVRRGSKLDKVDEQHKDKTVSKGFKFECQQCNKAYLDDVALRAHILSAHEGLRYACNQCSQQFTSQGSLRKHIETVHAGVKYACNQCDYQASQQIYLKNHIESKHENLKYPCNQCQYQGSKDALRFHLRTKHWTNSKK